MTAWLRREGHDVARCTVDRLMRDEAMNGLVRGRKPRAGAPAKDSQRAPDLLDRDFTAARPNAVWVTDFTYVRTWAGFAYVAFAIDVFSRAIVGWHSSIIKDTDMVLTTLKMALWRRDQAGTPVPEGMVHHTPRSGSARHCCSKAWRLPSAVSATRTTTPSRNPRSVPPCRMAENRLPAGCQLLLT